MRRLACLLFLLWMSASAAAATLYRVSLTLYPGDDAAAVAAQVAATYGGRIAERPDEGQAAFTVELSDATATLAARDPRVEALAVVSNADPTWTRGTYTYDGSGNMHARYYDPLMGRFVSVDPTWVSADLGKPQTWNRYSYVLNNPISNIDPDGKCGIPGACPETPDLKHEIEKRSLPGLPTPENPLVLDSVNRPLETLANVLMIATLVSPFVGDEAAGAATVAATRSNATNSIGGFSAAKSAIGKAEVTASKFRMGGGELVKTVMTNGARFVDQSKGTINVFMARPDGKAGFVRVTIDAANKILSVGLNQVKEVRNGLLSGRYRLYNW
jgi:RHS repeat-associated protein